MTPKDQVLKVRPEAVCKKNLAGTFDVYDNHGHYANGKTARAAWLNAWKNLPLFGISGEEE